MDRSFLSQPEVVRASRRYVCIRLATYENASEINVLSKIFLGGSGQVENTTFALLSPDATQLLARPGRAPQFAFRDAGEMARGMDALASYYPPRGKPTRLPAVRSLRLALNVAACDNLPLIAAIGDGEERQRLENRLAELAWQPELSGRAIFTVDSTEAALRCLGSRQSGYLIVQPGTYGQDGRVLAHVGADAGVVELRRLLAQFQPGHKDPREHVRQGQERGIYWQTAVPVTDPH